MSKQRKNGAAKANGERSGPVVDVEPDVGRPKRLNIRLTRQEFSWVRAEAKKHRTTLSKYARARLLG